MKVIDQKVLQELEFPQVLDSISQHCVTGTARQRSLNLRPLYNHKILLAELKQVNEMLTIVSYDNLPAFSSTEILEEIVLLRIENAALTETGLMNINDVSKSVNALLLFFGKKKQNYPHLNQRISRVELNTEISAAIENVIDRTGKVKSSASKELERIRRDIGRLNSEVNRAFSAEINRLKKEGWLGETTESFVSGRRVLSVLSEYKRKVSGHVMGVSNTGKLTYIEPASTIEINNEIVILENEERLEINRILLELSNYLRRYLPLIEAYQDIITVFDLLRAKARYAAEIGAVLPEIVNDQQIYLVKAYHPILLKRHNEKGLTTLPQSLSLTSDKRLLVISGPNAGGKSITLKTVGLLQVMLQSGLLVTCKDYSRFSFFDKILTDIGDNQSIENELSTYSYRLKQMKNILQVSNGKTLVLIDEFGTGSDPELGGALAEVFFQELHKRKCFGVVTTHYMNIKVLADKLEGVVNGCMLFNKHTLTPLFELSIGQPGSSFTFEVAQKIGIDSKIIEAAKSRVKKDKLNLDSSIADLQKAKADVDELKKNLVQAESRAKQLAAEFAEKSAAYDEKYENILELSGQNNRNIQYGRKFLQLLYEFDETSKNQKDFLAKVARVFTIEKAKENEKLNREEKEKKSRTLHKKSLKKPRAKEEPVINKPIVVGGQVRMADGNVMGIVQELSKNQATVLFGDFLTKVKVDRLKAV